MLKLAQERVHLEYCRLRNLNNLITTPEFEEWFAGIKNDDEKKAIVIQIHAKDIDAIKDKMRKGKESYGELMDRARVIGIRNYSRLSKEQLLFALERHNDKIRTIESNRETSDSGTVNRVI